MIKRHALDHSVALQMRDGSSVIDCSINLLHGKKQVHLFNIIGNQIAIRDKSSN